MRRLLQLGTMVFLIAAFLWPVAEWCDTWDAASLLPSDDTEFAVFAIVLALTLVLLIGALVSAAALIVTLIAIPLVGPPGAGRVSELNQQPSRFIPPLLLTPLRI